MRDQRSPPRPMLHADYAGRTKQFECPPLIECGQPCRFKVAARQLDRVLSAGLEDDPIELDQDYPSPPTDITVKGERTVMRDAGKGFLKSPPAIRRGVLVLRPQGFEIVGDLGRIIQAYQTKIPTACAYSPLRALYQSLGNQPVDFIPRGIALVFRPANIPQALRPANIGGDLAIDVKSAGHSETGLPHDLSHLRERVVDRLQRREDPEGVVDGCRNLDAGLGSGDGGDAQHVGAARLRREIHERPRLGVAGDGQRPAERAAERTLELGLSYGVCQTAMVDRVYVPMTGVDLPRP